jgi:tetratricopeptide (TPR) repeat protein
MPLHLSGSTSRWHHALTLSGLFVVLLGGASPASLAQPTPIAQAISRSPETITGELTANSPVLEDDGSYYEPHTFEGTAGETLTFDLTSDDFDAFLILQNPSGESIAQEDDGAGRTNARITATLPVTGTYTLLVNSYAAEETGTYLLDMRTATGEEQALAQASQLNQQAFELYQAGRYAEAIPLAEQALAIREVALGPEHPSTATSLNNLALLYYFQGRYGEAEPLYQQALAIYEEALGPEHPSTASSLNNLAGLYEAQGRYGEAEPLFQQALAIYEEALGPEHPSTASSLNNLAGLYEAQGRYGEAEPLYQQALAIYEEALGPEHPLTATSLNNLAGLYESQGRYGEAEPLYQQALAIREAALGPEHPDTASSLNNLAGLYQSQGRYGEAEPLYQQALAIYKEALGPEHPLTATSLNNLAFLYHSQGQLQSALTFLSQGLAIEETVLSRNLVGGSDANKRDYLATMGGTTDGVISLHLNDLPSDIEAGQLALATVLQRKGRILDLFTNVRTQLSDDPEALELLDELSATSAQLANLTFNPPTDLAADAYQTQLNALQQQMVDLEDQLSRRSIDFANLTASPSLEAIQAALPTGTALVEFIRYQPFDPTASPQERFGDERYAVYILQANGRVQGIDLGPADAINQATENVSSNLASASTPD